MFMVLNANFNNISVISWRSALLMEKTAISRENHCPVASNEHCDSFKYITVGNTRIIKAIFL